MRGGVGQLWGMVVPKQQRGMHAHAHAQDPRAQYCKIRLLPCAAALCAAGCATLPSRDSRGATRVGRRAPPRAARQLPTSARRSPCAPASARRAPYDARLAPLGMRRPLRDARRPPCGARRAATDRPCCWQAHRATAARHPRAPTAPALAGHVTSDRLLLAVYSNRLLLAARDEAPTYC